MNEKLSDNELLAIVNDEWEATQTERDLATELLAIRADAETSQNHNAAVMDRLYAEMEAAGYTGTWTDKVRQAIYNKQIADTAVITGHVKGGE